MSRYRAITAFLRYGTTIPMEPWTVERHHRVLLLVAQGMDAMRAKAIQ